MCTDCCGSVCAKCHSGQLVVFGVILIVNQLYLGWDMWILLGGLIVLKGLLKMAKPTCPHCETAAPAKKGRK